MIDLISRLDLFGSPVNLNINKFYFYRSKLGGMLSLGVAAVIILYLQSNFIQFIQQKKLTVSSAQTYDTSPELIEFGADKLMFGVNIYQMSYDFQTKPFYNMVLYIGTFTNDGVSQVTMTYTPLELEPCTEEHFKAYFNNNITDSSKEKLNIVSNFVCPKIDQIFKLQGQFVSTNYDFIRIDVKECVQSELDQYNPNWKATCADKATIQNQLAIYGPMRLTLYHNNFIISPDKEIFAEPYLNQDLSFQFIPNSMFKSVDVFFRNYQVETTTNSILGSSIEKKNYIVQNYKDYTEETVLGTQTSTHSQLFIRRSPFSQSCTRTHETFTQFLSSLGGFINILITVIGIFMRRYNQFQFTVELATKLYDFESKENDKDNKKQEVDNQYCQGTNQNPREDRLLTFPKKQSDKFLRDDMELSKPRTSKHAENDQFDIPISQSQQGFRNKGTTQMTTHKKITSTEYSQNLNSKFQRPQNSNRPLLLPTLSLIDTEQSKTQMPCQFNREATRKKMWKVIKIINSPNSKFKVLQILMRMKKINYQSKQQQKKFKDELKRNLKLGYLNRKDYLIEQFQKLVDKTQKQMSSGFTFFFHFITFYKAFNTQQNENLAKARRYINQDLDICAILNKLQEVDKLKKILFNKDQNVLFSFSHKPVIETSLKHANKATKKLPNLITVKNQSSLPDKSQEYTSEQLFQIKSTSNSLEQYEKLYEAFEKIKDKEKQSGYQKVNRRLIKELGSEIYSIFELSREDSQEIKDGLKENSQIGLVENQKELLKEQKAQQKRIQMSIFQNFENQESNYSSPIINNSFTVKIQQPNEEATPSALKIDENNHTNVTQVENEQLGTISFHQKNDLQRDRTIDSLAFDTIPDIPFEPVFKTKSKTDLNTETTLKKIS